MKRQAGFTVVELIITITIMVILLALGVVNLRSAQANARDEERKTDISNIALYMEGRYVRNNGSYLDYTTVDAPTDFASFNFSTIDHNNLRAPGVEAPNYSLIPASNAIETTTGVLPQPTESQYVYQPIYTAGVRCGSVGICRKFNLYYREEVTGTVRMVTSKNQ